MDRAVTLHHASILGGLELFDDGVFVGVDADVGGDFHAADDDLAGGEVGVPEQGRGGGEGVAAAGADGGDEGTGNGVRFNDVTVAGEYEDTLGIGDDEESLQLAEKLVGAPLLGEFDGGAVELAVELFELGLKAGEEGESVGGGASESGEDFVVVEAAELACGVLHDGATEGDLAIGGHDGGVSAAHAEHGGGTDAAAVSEVERMGEVVVRCHDVLQCRRGEVDGLLRAKQAAGAGF